MPINTAHNRSRTILHLEFIRTIFHRASMKRLLRSRSGGRQIYGPKWQSIGERNEIESDDESSEIAQISDTKPGNTIPSSEVAAAPPTVTTHDIDIELELPSVAGNGGKILSDCQSAMYKAALQGDWEAAEELLKRDRNLACEVITKGGDRALHVAVAIRNTSFVQKLVDRMNPSDLVMLDGRGYTACCYAAISGAVEIAELMTKKNQNLGTARDHNNTTPLHKAALRDRKEMVEHFLKFTKVEDLANEEWFDLLLATIRSEMYDLASEIWKKNRCIATMTNKDGTALHHLARQKISENSPAFELAKNLWDKIQRSEEVSVPELMKNPPILHDAAKVGNVDVITMLAETHPSLTWDTDSNGYTMFHIAVIHRQEDVFEFIHQIGAMKDLIVTSQDEKGNNILHLAGKKAPSDRLEIVYPSALQMRREIIWFLEVRNIVPRSCQEMKNRDGRTPRELFYKEHRKLSDSSETWMRNTADSCMLIATILLTVVFAAAFTVPGGNNQDTGIPLLLRGRWFTCFIIFEALAFLGSTYSMLMFWTIMTWSTRDFYEDNFLRDLLYILKWGLAGLLGSIISTISAFISAYFLVFVGERRAIIICAIILVYILLLYAIYNQFSAFFFSMTSVEYFFRFPSINYKQFSAFFFSMPFVEYFVRSPSRKRLFSRRVDNKKPRCKFFFFL